MNIRAANSISGEWGHMAACSRGSDGMGRRDRVIRAAMAGSLFCVPGAALYFLPLRLNMGLAAAADACISLAGACAGFAGALSPHPARTSIGRQRRRWLKRPGNDDRDKLLLPCASSR